MDNKLLIVDGSNLLFQMFFGMPARILNADGKPIQGTLGFVGALLKIIKMTSPTHVIVIFDGESENERCGLDESYKANRPNFDEVDEADNPFSQLPDIFRALEFLKIPYFETADCEADDIISGYALTYGGKSQVVISSFDSDFFQLITDNVTVLRYRGDNSVMCDGEYIRSKFAIAPDKYAEFKSLTGDTADNIKGVPKVGAKTAAELINTFGSLDGLAENAHLIKKPSVRESVIASADRIKLNFKLIKLNGAENLPFSLGQMEYIPSSVTTTEVLRAIKLK